MEPLTRWQTTALIAALSLAMVTNLTSFISLYTLRQDNTLSQTPQTLYRRHRRTFIVLAIILSIVTTGAQGTFAALFFNRGSIWAIYLLSSIIISSMVREVLDGLGVGANRTRYPPQQYSYSLTSHGLHFGVWSQYVSATASIKN
ncbi:hypothetical protein QBC46DRAFT_413384 [Diplogelasinospora grovesii]|uniref:Uncharacterized protein n=1 Tax=Diplogelasinospora grovesii TaxID=303347 RepID=A0AAN6RYZ3_9PEZI|nr:hypothetical protein QBC46DRAFT_413384 [Diplogelasinospora grovesii]